jgi:hypothetical protein
LARKDVRLEQAAWMRLEGQHRPRQALAARDPAGFADQRAMAQVHAIEVADGHRRAAECRGQPIEMMENLHDAGKLSAVRRPVKRNEGAQPPAGRWRPRG